MLCYHCNGLESKITLIIITCFCALEKKYKEDLEVTEQLRSEAKKQIDQLWYVILFCL